MDQVQISIKPKEAASWRQRCYSRMETLKSKQFLNGEDPASQAQPSLLQHKPFGEKNSVIFQLQIAVQEPSVDRFVDVLEQLCSERKLVLSDIFEQVTRAGDSLLHEAAYFKRSNIAELISHHFPHLLTKTNHKGDTPLHVAARAKTSSVIKVLLSQFNAHSQISSTSELIITRLANQCGNTALHEAVKRKHFEGANQLFNADKCVAHYLNKSGESPLYLAALSRRWSIIDILLNAPFPDDKPLPNCHGISPLHALIYQKNAALISQIVARKPDLMYLRDEDGGTPLHYAAARGYVEGVRTLLNKSSLTALEWNAKGHLPIHLACKNGRVKVVEEFLQQEWAYDSRVLINSKGQNVLHIAAKNGQHEVVNYLLRNTKFKELIMNEEDRNGNTPLHLAAKNFFPKILFSLTRDKRTSLNLKNNEGLTARDIIILQSEILMTSRQALSQMVLFTAGGRMTHKGRSLHHKRKIVAPQKVEWIKDRVNTLMLVAILIVTVTFAAGFTVPGSVYSSDDSNPHKRGMAVLGKKWMFQIFVIFNTIAMYSSTFGSFLLLWAQLGDYHLALRSFVYALFMVGVALVTMTLAFMAAVRLVVSNVAWLANLVTIIGIIFLCLISSIGILALSPIEFGIPLPRQVANLLVWFSISMYGNPSKVKSKKLETETCASQHADKDEKKDEE